MLHSCSVAMACLTDISVDYATIKEGREVLTEQINKEYRKKMRKYRRR
jgi:hypothetical protein